MICKATQQSGLSVVRFWPWLCAALLAVWQPLLLGQLYVLNQTTNTNGLRVTVGWNPSPDLVTGYMLCWGFASGECTNRLDVGNLASTTIGGLQTNVTYYFSVVAYKGFDEESPPSNEITYSVLEGSPVAAATKLNMELQSASASGAVALLRFQGISGGSYRIEASQDLQHWDRLWTTNCGSDGLVAFTVTDMAGYPMRFYRLLRE